MVNINRHPVDRKGLAAVAAACAVLLVAVLLVAVLLVAGLPGWLGATASSARSIAPGTSGANDGSQRLPASAAIATSKAGAHSGGPVALGPVPGSRVIAFSLILRGQNASLLAATLAAIDDPMSPQYHHYLSPAQFAAQFGPAAAARAQVEQYLSGAGFTLVDAGALAPFVQARGTADQIAATFGAHLTAYQAPDGAQYMTPTSAPKLPTALAGSVSGMLGLDTRPLVHTEYVPGLPSQVSGVSGLGPSDLAKAYDLGPLQSAGLNGSGVTIALAEIDTVDLNDIAGYDNQYNISAPQVRQIAVNGGSNSTSPEPALDIEVIHAIAPKATILDYEGQSDFASLAGVFSRIVSDRKAQVVSISLGVCEPDLSNADGQAFIQSINSTFQQADAEGMTVLVASGDNGAYGCGDNNLAVSAPASNPFVTAVGGTALFINGDSAYNHEAGWEGPLEGDGTGGGVSTLYSQPSWQSGSGSLSSVANGARAVPDVAADADPLTGYNIYYSGGKSCPDNNCFQVVGGTSAAAPFWAGLIALADQKAAAGGTSAKATLGFINPALYSLAHSGSGASAFHDVTLGGNLYYQCSSGWDAATGLGSPDGAVLVQDLLSGA